VPVERFVTNILTPQEALAKLRRMRGPEVTRRFSADPVPPEPRRSEIIEGLLDLRRSGELQGVWLDCDVIRVRDRWNWSGPPYRLTWKQAVELIGKNQERAGGPISSRLKQ
jgi:hypothetical protein